MDFTPPPPPPGAQPVRMHVGGLGDLFTGGERFSDFFDVLFGKRRPHGARFAFSARGDDVESEVSITMEEAHRGTSRAVTIPLEGPCPACGGSGTKDKKTCSVCGGSGSQTRLESFTVNIPRGVQDGSVIRVPGRGGMGLGGGPRGDLYLRVHIQPHERFRLRDDGHLELELPIAPWEAVLGGEVRVPPWLFGGMRISTEQCRVGDSTPPHSKGRSNGGRRRRALGVSLYIWAFTEWQ